MTAALNAPPNLDLTLYNLLYPLPDYHIQFASFSFIGPVLLSSPETYKKLLFILRVFRQQLIFRILQLTNSTFDQFIDKKLDICLDDDLVGVSEEEVGDRPLQQFIENVMLEIDMTANIKNGLESLYVVNAVDPQIALHHGLKTVQRILDVLG